MLKENGGLKVDKIILKLQEMQRICDKNETCRNCDVNRRCRRFCGTNHLPKDIIEILERVKYLGDAYIYNE